MNSGMLTNIITTGTTPSVIRKNYSIYEYIAGAVQFRANHWCLFIALVKTKQIIYLDPFGANECEENQVFSNWNKFCKTRSLKNNNWK